MADKIILVDTSILIDYYRKTDKEKFVWINLVRQGYSFAVSAVTKYEIYAGATPNQLIFWDNVFVAITVMPLDEVSVDTAVAINSVLKKRRKQIDLADLFIAATAVAHNFPLVTLNRKHFDRIDALTLID
jgi:predicted nucleic acid-binding protein